MNKIDKLPGIYKITNVINGKIYIGSAVNCFRRLFNEHLKDLIKNKHINTHLQRAFNKYGKENFNFEVLEYVIDKDDLIKREQYYFNTILFATEKNDKFKKNSYNIARIAGSCLGTKRSEECKEKASERMKGKNVGENNPNYNNKWSDEQKKNLSNKLTGISLEDKVGKEKAEIIKNELSDRMKLLIGDKNYMFGKKHSEESKEKISDKLFDKYSGKKSSNYKGGYIKPKNKLELNDVKEINVTSKITRQSEKSGKPVIQYNNKMEIIKEWTSIKSASDILNISRGSIKNCCDGKTRHAGFFIWRLKGKENVEYKFRSNLILQIDKNDECIGKFEQIIIAAETLKISRNGISRALKSGKTYCGFYWKYND